MEDIVGPQWFAQRNTPVDPHGNRELLLELCQGLEAVLANAFHERPVEEVVTYFDLGASPMEPISHEMVCPSS